MKNNSKTRALLRVAAVSAVAVVVISLVCLWAPSLANASAPPAPALMLRFDGPLGGFLPMKSPQATVYVSNYTGSNLTLHIFCDACKAQTFSPSARVVKYCTFMAGKKNYSIKGTCNGKAFLSKGHFNFTPGNWYSAFGCG